MVASLPLLDGVACGHVRLADTSHVLMLRVLPEDFRHCRTMEFWGCPEECNEKLAKLQTQNCTTRV